MKTDNAPLICYDASSERGILVESSSRIEEGPIQDPRVT
jgi:hypothetical protein